MTGRERVLAVLQNRPTDRLPLMPITMMYAADQIGAKYGDYTRDHRVLVEAQMRTAEKFGFDYVSCISDPAREAADCGAAIRYYDDQPPAICEEDALLADKSRLAGLQVPNPFSGGRMEDRIAGAELLRKEAGDQYIVEGWIEGPCAEAADLRGINRLMTDFFDDPQFVQDLFEFVVEMELAFARAQIEAGAELIGIGDAAASLVGPQLYEQYVWPYEKRMVDGVHALGGLVRLHICGNINKLLGKIGELGCDIVDLDYMVPVADARAAMGPDQVLLGNIHPVKLLRNGTAEQVTAAIAQCHREAVDRYIVGAGCEIPRGTPEENVFALRDYAASCSQAGA